MRLPPSVRYLPSRLQFVFNPWLWLGALITGIVGIYTWEYRQDPTQVPWQLNTTEDNSAGSSASADALLESLTPEEQVVAAELDNLDLLLSELDADISVLTSGGESSAAATLNAALANSSLAKEAEKESSVTRLNRYIEEYSFLGAGPQAVNGQSVQTPPGAESQTSSVVPLTPFVAPNQATNSPQPPGTHQLNQSTNPSSAEANATGTTAETPTGNNTAFSFDQTGAIPGSLDGLNRSFIRTTPNMSPPPGTTGYVPPTSVVPNVTGPATANNGFAPVAPAALTVGTPAPAIPQADRSQVLPPVTNPVVTPVEVPTVDGTVQVAPQPPRNAWESFFD